MAQLRTKNRSARASNRNTEPRANDSVQVSFPRAFINRVTAWYRERDQIAETVGARIAATALSEARTVQSAARTLGMELSFDQPANERRRGRPRTAAAPVTATAPTPPRQARNRRSATTGNRNRRAGGLNLQNLGNGTTLADQVARALPNIGGATTIDEIARQCRTSRGTRPNNQAIGGVLNRFQTAGLVDRQGNAVTALRDLRQARAA